VNVGTDVPDDAGNRRGLVQTLSLHQQRQCLEASPASRDVEPASFGAVIGEHRSHAQALKEPTAGDVLGHLVNGYTNLDAPYIGLAQDELVEGNVPVREESDFLSCFRHQFFSTRGVGNHSPDLTSR